MHLYAHNIASWADYLNSHKQWTDALNGALDAIGFTREYLTTLAAPAMGLVQPPRFKAVKDTIWQMVDLDPFGVSLIDCPLLQRLRFIKQLGFSYLTYPGAQHSRFEHTLGVYHVVDKLLDSFRKTEALDKLSKAGPNQVHAKSYGLDAPEAFKIKAAALLHDIGHAVFSHVSESYFYARRRTHRIGPFTIQQFTDTFNEFYKGMRPGTKTVMAARENKRLSELFAVSIITSARFSKFFELLQGRPRGSPRETLSDIGALMLGDPISPDDRALPQMLSGPCDADKIDYMSRDAYSSGIFLSIDVSRMFFRAGVYEVRDPSMLAPEVRKQFDYPTAPQLVFILDQSGTDAVREMGAARISLYSRIYHHQLTRNAETHFKDLLDIAAADPLRFPFSHDLLRLWCESDIGTLESLARDQSMPGLMADATDLKNRRLLKRGACFSVELLADVALSQYERNNSIATAGGVAKGEAIDALDATIQDPVLASALADDMRAACKDIRDAILKSGFPEHELPVDETPSHIRFVAAPETKESLLPGALVLTPGRHIAQLPTYQPSYVEAARLMDRRGYVLVPRAWQSICLLAFQRVLFDRYLVVNDATIALQNEDLPEEPEQALKNGESQTTQTKTKVKVAYRPVLNLVAAAEECRMSSEVISELQSRAGDAYASAPNLVPITPEACAANELAKKFESYRGDFGWSVNRPDAICHFVAQFPPILRGPAVQLLKSVRILDRPTLGRDVWAAIQKLPEFGQRPFLLAPLSPSSGNLIRSYLKDRSVELQASKCLLYSEVHSALQDAQPDVHRLVIYDDNIASGSQATKQLRIWCGGPASSARIQSNYSLKAVDETALDKLRKIPCGFAFAVAHSAGIEALLSAASELKIKLAEHEITYASSLKTWTGAAESSYAVPANLRQFLASVGQQLMMELALDEGLSQAAAVAQAEQRKLGYDNLEGLLVTSLNVPSSTYSALWCPGSYVAPNSKPIAWRPLFIRSELTRALVLS
jgi:HD superfamily phosphohydrolase